MKQEINVDVLMELFQKKSSNSVFLDSLTLFKPTKENIKVSLFLLGISIVPSYLISTSPDTVNKFNEIVGVALDLLLALFGIVFTGYAFFQALINRTLLIRLFASTEIKRGREISELQKSNESFVELMMLIVLSIFVSFFLTIIIGNISEDFVIFSDNIINEILACAGSSVYLYFIFMIIWEIKSFVFNIFQLFNAHAATKLLDVLKGETEL